MGNAFKKTLERRALNIALGVLLGLLLGGGVLLWQTGKDKVRVADMRMTAMNSEMPHDGPPGGPFTLTDQDGKTVTEASYPGKYLLVYFGYTFCPDMCPTGLTSIAKSLDELSKDADLIKPLFITIDPARDTSAVLKNYVQSFNPSISGLTGTPDQIAAVAKEYQVYYQRQDMDDDSGEYMMDHSSLIYLMDPKGKYITSFPEDVPAATLTKALRATLGKASAATGTPATPVSPPVKP